MKNRLHELLHGFAVAHLYYFLIAVAPVLMKGRRILRAPRILAELIGEEGNMMPEEYEPRQEQHQFEFRDRDRDGSTPAHIAAKLGNLPDMQQLVAATTSNAGGHRRRLLLTAPDQNGWQPLHEAARGGYLEIIQYLAVEQAQYVDLHATTNSGQSPLSLAQEFHGEDHPVTRLLLQITTSDNDDGDDGDDDEDSDENDDGDDDDDDDDDDNDDI